MRTSLEILTEIETLIDELNDIAHQLSELSKHDISEDSIVPLQKRQESILMQINELDEKHPLEASELNGEEKKIQKNIQSKLKRFKKLNELFISHIRRNKEVIDFEK